MADTHVFKLPGVIQLEVPQHLMTPEMPIHSTPGYKSGINLSQFIRINLEKQKELPDFIVLREAATTLTPEQIGHLVQALKLSEKHGFSVPRHEQLGIAAFPPRKELELVNNDSVITGDIHHKVSKLLPETTIAPYAEGPVVIAKTHVLLNSISGLSDEEKSVFGIKELSIHANLLGYSSVLSNKVFISVPGAFKHVALGEIEGSTPNKWDGYIAHLEKYFLHSSLSPFDIFSKILYSTGEPPRILIDMTSVEPAINGTSRNALSFLEQLKVPNLLTDKGAEITVRISQESSNRFNLLPCEFFAIAHSDSELSGTFDVGVFLSPIASLQQAIHMNRRCLRWLVCHLDIISLRVLPLLTQDVSRANLVYDTMRFCDEAIFISEASRKDFKDYFPESLDFLKRKSVVIHEGTPGDSTRFPVSEKSFEISQIIDISEPNYILVLGNEYPHKLVRQASIELANSGFNVVALGIKAIETDNFLSIPSGALTDQLIKELISNCLVAVFPSSYEGYGIPIAEIAECGKPIVLFDSEVSREVVNSLKYSSHSYYFLRLDNLPTVVSAAMKEQPFKSRKIRTLSAFNLEIIRVVFELLNRPVSHQNLMSRWAYFTALDNYTLRLREEIKKSSEIQQKPSPVKKILNRIFR